MNIRNDVYELLIYESILTSYLSNKYSVSKETIKPREQGCFIIDEDRKLGLLIDWKEIDKVLPIPLCMKKYLKMS
jgi:hypothetical protein